MERQVGRLLSTLNPEKGDFDFSGLVPLEEYLDEHRDLYYFHLEEIHRTWSEFIRFFWMHF